MLARSGYGQNGEVIGLDVKAMRTQPHETAATHLKNSLEIALLLEDLCKRIDRQEWQSYVDARDYEALDLFILRNLMGK